MSEETFKALVLRQDGKATTSAIEDVPETDLPEGDVLVDVAYSTLNYKDGLAITGKGKVIRSFPMVPGIDFVGTVRESQSDTYKPGDPVILTGWGVGEQHWGGMGQLARVKSEWLVPLPQGMSARDAMGIGTAGFTAMLCVLALEEHGMEPGGREVVVTGAAGGVGSVAVAVLAKLGHTVVASTGRSEESEYLQKLGAASIIGRDELSAPGKPMERERWGGAVDTVGGEVLAGVIRAMAQNTSVAACGNAGGMDLHTTVFPFILRGVNLLGINSVLVPLERRKQAWQRLQQDLDTSLLDTMIEEIGLSDVPEAAQTITNGKVRGRVVIDVQR